MGGILPFGCIFIQLFFILNSIWYGCVRKSLPVALTSQSRNTYSMMLCICLSVFCVCVWSFRSHQMYYMFGFLFLVFIILLITCSEATVLLCYFHLCAEVRRLSGSFPGLCTVPRADETIF